MLQESANQAHKYLSAQEFSCKIRDTEMEVWINLACCSRVVNKEDIQLLSEAGKIFVPIRLCAVYKQ